jgi:sugar fermentation stimulation protein A
MRSRVKFKSLIPAEFVWRDSRFTAAVRVDGELSHAHIANTGRLPGLFEPGRKVWLSEAKNLNRRTRYDLKLIDIGDQFVSIDTRIPNILFKEAVQNLILDEFRYPDIQNEVKLGRSRLDFRLSGPKGICWIETKSVTLVKDKIALFPDAPTQRGRKHLEELSSVLDKNVRSAVVFIIQRSDASSFSPNWDIDRDFSQMLVQVISGGVEIKAYLCQVGLRGISIDKEIPANINYTSEKIHV